MKTAIFILALCALAHADEPIPYDPAVPCVETPPVPLSPARILDRPDAWIQFGHSEFDGAGSLGVALPVDVFRLAIGETFRRWDHDRAVAQIDLTLALGDASEFAVWWARPRFVLDVGFDTGTIGGETALQAGWWADGRPNVPDVALWGEIGKVTNGAFWFGLGAQLWFGDSEFRVRVRLEAIDYEGEGSTARLGLRPSLRIDGWSVFFEGTIESGVISGEWLPSWMLGVEFRA